MYPALLFTHSLFRWLVVVSLFYAIFRSYRGLATGASFSKTDNIIRHWTATFTHIQFMIGYTLYFISPLIKAFFANKRAALHIIDLSFFAIIHMLLMTVAVVVITIGSARAKRKEHSPDKYRTMLRWFAAGLLIIFVAIPWPFSPLAKRPWFRTSASITHPGNLLT